MYVGPCDSIRLYVLSGPAPSLRLSAATPARSIHRTHTAAVAVVAGLQLCRFGLGGSASSVKLTALIRLAVLRCVASRRVRHQMLVVVAVVSPVGFRSDGGSMGLKGR